MIFRDWLRTHVPRRIQSFASLAASATTFPPDMTEKEKWAYLDVADYTMTTPERVAALSEAVRYVVAQAVPGAIVECGVWRGGSMMAVANALREIGAVDRDLYLFDTYEGMTEPSSADIDVRGGSARALLARIRRKPGRGLWCVASEAEVTRNMRSTGYPEERVHLVPGRVEDTLPGFAPEKIALLRLDTDWYESTRHELVCLFPRVSAGGVIIIDDYGHWQGARQAVDEFIRQLPSRPLLQRIDYSARLMIKT